ncbi:MAG: hypothetical protein UT64_C0035G0004 [Candidatus Falkowbacteria bacterium GW2011_GWF2_39_8]|uniref:Uncharacterized protein n=1 Tax=Candidatus Falkowbacteria bacterium GW2011_GWF2_39_8 TaxID=1618642 RepID=A0A0G0SCD1_9BACT|nr:MAG: hypothetical protein UT64_C0035G0004 [Candidatus Falkowbacteria bacterium GW2011_GWF2_39_8]
MASNISWKKIFEDYKILNHNFSLAPFNISAEDIKKCVQNFEKTTEKEVRILCKMDTRKQLPEIMRDNNLILLPINNGEYVIVKGEGFVDIENIEGEAEEYNTKLGFNLDTSKIGNSEMQHLDFAYASSLIRTFMDDPSLVLTIRGRKYTPEFDFIFNNQNIKVKSVQTEVDAGYEGKDKVVLIEAKNSKTTDTIIRQLYYPFRQWSEHTSKEVFLLFFEKRKNEYLIWQYAFTNKKDYNSIKLVKSKKYKIV